MSALEARLKTTNQLLPLLIIPSHPFPQPSDSRKSTSSDSGVVSPAEIADDRQLVKPQKPLKNLKQHQQYEKKKATDVDHHNRMYSGRTVSGESGKSSSKGCTNPPSCNSSDSGQGTEPLDGVRFSYHLHVPSELTGEKEFSKLFICLTSYTAAFDIGTWVRSDALKYGRQSNIKLVAIRLPDSILKSKI